MRTLFFVLLVGCSDALNATADTGRSSDTGSSESDGTGDIDSAGSDSDAFVAGSYSLAAGFSILAGLPSVEDAEVGFVLADASAGRWDCEMLAPDDLAVADPPPAGLYAWLSLTVPSDNGCELEGLALPARLGIGIGPMDAEVRAQLGRVDKDTEAASLWGAYASADEGPTYAFGYAEGADGVDAESAPPDGTYRLEPLLVEALPPSE